VVAVEGVRGLADLEHDEVGEIDEQVDGPLADGEQEQLHPERRGPVGGAVDREGAVAGATLGLVDRDRVLGEVVEPVEVDAVERPEPRAGDRGELACEPVVAPEVGAVGDALVVDLDEPVFAGGELIDGVAGLDIVSEFDDTLVERSPVEFVGRSEHAFAGLAVDLARFDGLPAGEGGAGGGVDRVHADADVGRGADGARGSAASEIEHQRVGGMSLDGLGLGDAGDLQAGGAALKVVDVLDLGGGHGELGGGLFGRELEAVEVQVEPPPGEFHDRVSGVDRVAAIVRGPCRIRVGWGTGSCLGGRRRSSCGCPRCRIASSPAG